MELKSILLVAHVLAVTCGVGGALMLDIYLVRHLRGAMIEERDAAFARYVAIFVKIGLVGLWASGIAILAIAPDGPASVIENPKVQAKLVIVVVLTLNALIIETVALPLVERNVGRYLFDGVGEAERTLLLASGAVSSASWTVPLVLGLARELNHVVPAATILGIYAGLVCLGIATAQIAGRYLYRPERDTAAQRPAPRFHAAAQQAIEASFAPPAQPVSLMDAYARERTPYERAPLTAAARHSA
jgi:hypothetical protein